MKKIEILFLTLILIGAFAVRLYKFTNPIADWHSWRQVDTSAVSRNFVQNGFDVLHPKFEDLSKGVSLIDNPQGYRFVEFPIYNVLQASLFKYANNLTLEEWGRIVTIFSSLLSIVFIFLIVRKYISITAAFAASFFFAFIPFNIYFGRTLLPDPSMVAAALGATYFFGEWIKSSGLKLLRWNFILALILMILSLLLSPYTLFFTLPLIYLAFERFGVNLLKEWKLWFFMIISLAPLAFWRIWMLQYPAGIPQNLWLFNGSNIRFSGAFFHWIFAVRIGEFLLGYFGLPFVILGIIKKFNPKEGLFFLSFLASSLIYIFVIATGNVQHDYYQILIIPTFAIFFGKGVDMVINNFGGVFNRRVAIITTVVCVGFMLAFSWFAIRDFYDIQHPEIIQAGTAVDMLTPKNAKVIAPYGGDTTFLYYSNRNGWPIFDRSLKQFIKQGATVMAFVNPGTSELNFKNYFVTIASGPKYIIYDLTRPLKPIQ